MRIALHYSPKPLCTENLNSQLRDTYNTIIPSFVRPVKNPVLSAFCTKMTGISQHQVDASGTIEVVLQAHTKWLREQTCNARNDEILFVTDGDADLGEFLKIQERVTPGLRVDPVYGRWSNIKVEFCKKYKKATSTAQKKLQAMLQTAGISLVPPQPNHSAPFFSTNGRYSLARPPAQRPRRFCQRWTLT
jgi:inhibitor of KinA sporulation pathway (predicted exonuclease)